MRVVLLFNPRSGRARGPTLARNVRTHLVEHGVEVDLLDVREDWRSRLPGAGALLVTGGDGSVLHALQAAATCDVPIYHVPTGNENLFAREFGQQSNPARVLAALRAGRTRRIDLGRATTADGWSSLFSMMCSIGPDASVVHRLESARTSGGGHLVYFRPILAELARPHLPRLRAELDGRELAKGEPGVLIVANARQYALGINPARDADPADRLLDVVFLPARGRLAVLRWAWRCRSGADLAAAGAAIGRGQVLRVEPVDGPTFAQMEGELVRGAVAPGKPLTVTTEPQVLRVLLPSTENR